MHFPFAGEADFFLGLLSLLPVPFKSFVALVVVLFLVIGLVSLIKSF